MNESFIVIILLLILLGFQQVYFLKQISKLTEKLMAKSYGEFVQAQMSMNEKPKQPDIMSIPVEPSEEDMELKMLNSMLAPPF